MISKVMINNNNTKDIMKNADNTITIESIAQSIVANRFEENELKSINKMLKYDSDVVDKIFNEIHEFYQEREQEILNKFLEIRNVETVNELYIARKLREKGIAEAMDELDDALTMLGFGDDELKKIIKFAIRVLQKLENLCNIMYITKDYIYSRLADSLIKLGYDKRSLTGEIYRFTDKTGWEHIPINDFKKNLNSIYNNINEVDIDKVLEYLNTLPDPVYNVIQFLNGQYFIETHELKETDKEIFPLLNIPYEYNPEAKPTLINEFLENSLPNYDTKAIFEVIGYLFTSGNSKNVMVWLTSTGGGKSVLGNILRAIFYKQTCAVDIGAMGRFDKGNFISSHINICSEIDNKATAKAKDYKDLTGNDELEVERKFKDRIMLPKEEVPKQIQICNNMPKFDTLDSPLLQRFLIIQFKHKFRGTDKQIEGLEDKIIESKEDMEWLIYNSLEAHKEMQETCKDFAIRLSEAETRKMVIANNMPLVPAMKALVEFDDEFGIIETSEMMEAEELKKILSIWIKEKGLNLITDKTGEISSRAIMGAIKTAFDIGDETWQDKADNPYKEAKYHTIRKSVKGKRKRYYPFLKPTPEYERIKTKWAEEKQSGQENQKPTETNTKQNKTHELYYEEVDGTVNQPKQKTII